MAGSSPFTGKDIEIVMNHQCQEHEPGRSGRRRARSRWWAVGLAGMTGLALTAVVVGVPATGAAGQAFTAADDPPGKPDRSTATDHRNEGKADGKARAKKSKGVPVPCDADKLIAAITLANARGGAVLDLAKGCTYLLTANIDGNGLPIITAPITLNGGKHTTITRAAAADQFRIATVGTGGDLTLNHLTIAGGQTTNAGTDGAGIFVSEGGALTTNHSTVTRNIAGGNGGGIVNNGITRINASTLRHNTAGIVAGGVTSSGALDISKSRIYGNTANAGAGVASSGTVRIEDSSISDNQAQDVVGGILVNGGTAVVTDSGVTSNTAGGAVGGILANVGSQVTLTSVTLAKNVASAGLGGGLAIETGGTAAVADSTIEHNNASLEGGGIYNADELIVRNTKVTGNQADLGGGIYNADTGTLTLFTTKIIKNVAVTDGGGIFNDVGGTVELNTATGTVVVKNRPNNCSGDVPGCPG
ncbi:right-handed parallel beta-helix repeat-containing protein [Salinispora arenicola]|uniref:right-handed parallel beta-helix repeat-containing protein n=1 Tax=Salinispora arenicola TaxID=168697 RepID=UPI0020796B1C|nr:right-handed parallel beta-helix repeat-containing protein [Salinispora arenicola]MCN0180160.1 right-handed parallel beta-helix repeat-containing protein [Salinispora arenicola]